ncbi:hypothetical protein AB205_0051840 [Aquarana catesbeiana]|uniref:Uncharacterized protein n=1 Tax=Aquarana catesbeiana TaxID=8400 RepID=A0A2G9Q4I2_AQUCT|nr:hypothetical protein AB205_0051840 [Aquarana catesbeiana]
MREIMGCNLELENLNKTSMMLFKKIKTSLMFWGEFKTPHNPFVFLCTPMFTMFERFFEKPNLEDAHSVPTCAICHHGRSMDTVLGVQPLPQ